MTDDAQRSPVPMVAVIGCPRSGTSLFAGEMARRYAIAVPFETHFIPIFDRWRGLYGDLTEAGKRRRLLEDIYLYTDLWIGASKTFSREHLEKASILVTRPNADGIIGQSHDFASLVHALYASFAQTTGCPYYADKSAPHAPVDLAAYSHAVGSLKVINVVRDGRDVFSSWRDNWFGTRNVVRAARLWRDHLEKADAWAAAHPDDFLTVRYEDLARDSDATFAEVGRFLGLAPSQQQAAPQLLEAMATADEHRRLDQGVDTASIGRHAAVLEDWQRDLFEDIAAAQLVRHGYALQRGAGQGRAQPLRGAWERLAAPVDRPLQALQRKVKSWLPLIFVCGGRGIARALTRQ